MGLWSGSTQTNVKRDEEQEMAIDITDGRILGKRMAVERTPLVLSSFTRA